eukprot:5343487-Alexandrium_andersonii.AAC.1
MNVRHQLRPEWDVQAVLNEGVWCLALADHDETPLLKDIAVDLPSRELLQRFEQLFEEKWSTWGGRAPSGSGSKVIRPPHEGNQGRQFFEQDHIRFDCDLMDPHITASLDEKLHGERSRRAEASGRPMPVQQ